MVREVWEFWWRSCKSSLWRWEGRATVVMALEEEVLRIICVYGPQSGRTGAEKERFYDDLRSEWDLHSVGELVLGMGDFNGHVGKLLTSQSLFPIRNRMLFV